MMKFTLIALPYAPEDLEPVISREIISIHHGKHLAGYVNNLNGLLEGSGLEEDTLEEIVCKATGGILNNAGQVLNHNLYFSQFGGKQKKTEPSGTLAKAIVRDFGSFYIHKQHLYVLFMYKLFERFLVWKETSITTLFHGMNLTTLVVKINTLQNWGKRKKKNKATAFTGDRFISSIGISFLR